MLQLAVVLVGMVLVMVIVTVPVKGTDSDWDRIQCMIGSASQGAYHLQEEPRSTAQQLQAAG